LLGGEPGRLKSPEEQGVPTRAKHPGGIKGHGFSGGMKPLKRRYEAGRFRKEAQERRGKRERFADHLGGEKL
jgi:hypothetical protein